MRSLTIDVAGRFGAEGRLSLYAAPGRPGGIIVYPPAALGSFIVTSGQIPDLQGWIHGVYRDLVVAEFLVDRGRKSEQP